MHEALYLHILRNIIPDLPDLLQRQFSGRYHPLRALFMPEAVRHIVGIVRLRGNMNICFGTDFPCQHKHTGIRYNQRIRPQIPQLSEIVRRPFQIIIVRHNICRYIYTNISLMGAGNPLRHLFHGKIFRLCPQAVSLAANINGVRPKNNSRF